MNEPTITQTRGTFSLTCTVELNIKAATGVIWSLLTDAQGFSRWNSTVTGIEGQIREGERHRCCPAGAHDLDRRLQPIFKGVRTFALQPRGDGTTDFTMKERFSGVM